MPSRVLILERAGRREAGAALERALGEAGAERLSSGVYRVTDEQVRSAALRERLEAFRNAGGRTLVARVADDGTSDGPE